MGRYLFMKELRKFISVLSIESDSIIDPNIGEGVVDGELAEELVEYNTPVYDDIGAEEMKVEVKDMSDRMENLIDSIKSVNDSNPLEIEPIVEITNNDIQELADKLEVEAPRLELDKETYEVTKESMESVDGFINNIFKLMFIAFNYFSKENTKYFNSKNESLKVVIKRIERLLPQLDKRIIEGINYLDLDMRDKRLRYTVVYSEVVTDLGSTLLKSFDMLAPILGNYISYFESRTEELGKMVGITDRKPIGTSSVLVDAPEYKKMTDDLLDRIESMGGLPGNKRLVVNGKIGENLLKISFQEFMPEPSYTLVNSKGIRPMSNEQIRLLHTVLVNNVGVVMQDYLNRSISLQKKLESLGRIVERSSFRYNENLVKVSGDTIRKLNELWGVHNTKNISREIDENLSGVGASIAGITSYLGEVMDTYVWIAEESVKQF